ncbi:hypothetical protein [Lentilactobacillus kefiri]|uniref:Surface layer protein A domain-containing protein n=2 Tax=Lentilactobacillus kefiri TaxID=33962 RepID=A0A8E1RHJ8_LENKE|nr:hypothetical protein [Lentilactobacillus kefiri]KRM49368.1 hypothetical protein FC95_GL000615 [Lentilactobacillus kefiri DSM 20587 = JCM 5818]MCJ2162814.1 hypothetical protein [Lentilactobacillus kefiri]MDM7493996.1 hypothetical protein [Lentilactobacillus kefiri]UOD78911.1 hypothetical protein MTO92_03560 [Lentilactobacillus kefiri]
MMKKVDLANAGLLMLIPLTMIGFSASIHAHNSDISTTKAAEVNKIGETIDTEYSGNTELNQGKMRPLYFQASRVFSVKYRTVNFKTVLDEDYKEEKLYRYVPGAKKNNRTYSWKKIKAHTGKKVYVDKKAKAYYRDDDGERESEDFYRIRVSAKKTANRYWINEDAIDD